MELNERISWLVTVQWPNRNPLVFVVPDEPDIEDAKIIATKHFNTCWWSETETDGFTPEWFFGDHGWATIHSMGDDCAVAWRERI